MEHRATWRRVAVHSLERHEVWFSWASGLAALVYVAAAFWSASPSARPSSAEAGAHRGDPRSASTREHVASDARAHNELGVAYAEGARVERDDAKALSLFALACEQGHAEGCGNLGAMLEKGRGTQADIERAVRLYERACSKSVPLACSNLGAVYLEGKSVEADATYAGELFAWACQAGSAVGCSNLAALGEQAPSQPRAPARN